MKFGHSKYTERGGGIVLSSQTVNPKAVYFLLNMYLYNKTKIFLLIKLCFVSLAIYYGMYNLVAAISCHKMSKSLIKLETVINILQLAKSAKLLSPILFLVRINRFGYILFVWTMI